MVITLGQPLFREIKRGHVDLFDIGNRKRFLD